MRLSHFQSRIGLTLTLVFVLLAVTPNTLLALFVIQQSNNQAYEQGTNQLASIADFRTKEIEGWLNNGKAVLNAALEDTLQYARMVTTVEARDRRLAPTSQLDNYLKEFLETQDIFTELFLYTAAGEIRSAMPAEIHNRSHPASPRRRHPAAPE